MLRFLCVVLFAGLLGCTTMEANRATMRDRYVGKPLSTAVAGLGYPSSQLKMTERQIYAWVKDDSFGNPCELRLEVDAGGVVVGESMEARIPEACEKFTN